MFIREKLGFMMYNNGKGEVITKTEYLRWKFRNNQKVSFKKIYIYLNLCPQELTIPRVGK